MSETGTSGKAGINGTAEAAVIPEVSTREGGGEEDGNVERKGQSPGERGTLPSGRNFRDIRVRSDREARAWKTVALKLTGGIVLRLIQKSEDQLKEALECVEWYQRKAEECRRELDELRVLYQQFENVDEEDVDSDG